MTLYNITNQQRNRLYDMHINTRNAWKVVGLKGCAPKPPLSFTPTPSRRKPRPLSLPFPHLSFPPPEITPSFTTLVRRSLLAGSHTSHLPQPLSLSPPIPHLYLFLIRRQNPFLSPPPPFANTNHRHDSASSAIPTPSFLISVFVSPLPSPLSLSHSAEKPPFSHLWSTTTSLFTGAATSRWKPLFTSLSAPFSPLPSPLSLSHSPVKEKPSLTFLIGR